MKAWRESASLILAARKAQKCNPALSGSAYDYKLLNLKRHKNSSFMPGSYVFPGGMVEPSDADLKWYQLFSSFGIDVDSFESLSIKSSKRPPIFEAKKNELPRDVSLRISAVRETFEECGILLCRRTAEKGILTKWAEHMVPDEMKNWQTRVHNDSREFYAMCERLRCYPDIWSLKEWSNWLTPTLSPIRFDTIFYMACMAAQPPAEFESKEMEDLKWEDPKTLLCPSNSYKLAPPQHCEISRIAKFESLNNLLDFAIARNKIGIQQNFPIRIRLSDGHVHVMPGDSMYPDQVNLTEQEALDMTTMTIAEFRKQSPVKIRIEHHNSNVKTRVVVVDNYESIFAV